MVTIVSGAAVSVVTSSYYTNIHPVSSCAATAANGNAGSGSGEFGPLSDVLISTKYNIIAYIDGRHIGEVGDRLYLLDRSQQELRQVDRLVT